MGTDDNISSEEAFGAIANEVRIHILRSFVELNPSGEGTVTFSELFERSLVSSSSQFAYHIENLEGIFLEKSEDGYSLTMAGQLIVRGVIAGTFHERAEFDAIEIEGICSECGPTTLRTEHTNLVLRLKCDACGETVVTYDVLPAETVERTSFEILESCDRRAHHSYASALRGTCTLCGGLTDLDIVEAPPDSPRDIFCLIECRQCGYPVHAPLTVSLCYHPEVISFYWERGVDIQQVPFWRIHKYLTDWSVDVLSDEPFRANVTIRYSGDETSIALDDGLSVSELAPVIA